MVERKVLLDSLRNQLSNSSPVCFSPFHQGVMTLKKVKVQTSIRRRRSSGGLMHSPGIVVNNNVLYTWNAGREKVWKVLHTKKKW